MVSRTNQPTKTCWCSVGHEKWNEPKKSLKRNHQLHGVSRHSISHSLPIAPFPKRKPPFGCFVGVIPTHIAPDFPNKSRHSISPSLPLAPIAKNRGGSPPNLVYKNHSMSHSPAIAPFKRKPPVGIVLMSSFPLTSHRSPRAGSPSATSHRACAPWICTGSTLPATGRAAAPSRTARAEAAEAAAPAAPGAGERRGAAPEVGPKTRRNRVCRKLFLFPLAMRNLYPPALQSATQRALALESSTDLEMNA